jgi:hypothetical protein
MTTLCQTCKSKNLVCINGKSSDLNEIEEVNGSYHTVGYLPNIANVCGGDYIEFTFCLDCGQIQGKFPVEIEKDKDEKENWGNLFKTRKVESKVFFLQANHFTNYEADTLEEMLNPTLLTFLATNQIEYTIDETQGALGGIVLVDSNDFDTLVSWNNA